MYFPGESAVIRIGIRRVRDGHRDDPNRDDVDDNKNYNNTNTTSSNNNGTNTNRAKQPIQQLGATLIELTNTDHLLQQIHLFLIE